MLLLHSIEPRHLTNQSHPRVPWANGFLLIVEYCIHHIINIHDDDVMDQKHDLSGGDARERSNRCALPRRSSVLGEGSWRPFRFDHIFCSMIFGRVMANIHGGGSRTVAFRPFSEVVRAVWCLCFFGSDVEEVKKPVPLFFQQTSIMQVVQERSRHVIWERYFQSPRN